MRSTLNIPAELAYLTSLTIDPEAVDPRRYHAIATALAEHVRGPASYLAWWTQTMGGPDGSECTIAEVARTAGVPYAHCYYARYAPREGQRVCAILSAERDAVFARVLDTGERIARTTYNATARLLPENSPSRISGAALLDTYARARLPILFDGMLDSLDGESGEPLPPESRTRIVYSPITCPREECQHTWTPRVERPRKCPACQNYIRYRRLAALAQGEAQAAETE